MLCSVRIHRCTWSKYRPSRHSLTTPVTYIHGRLDAANRIMLARAAHISIVSATTGDVVVMETASSDSVHDSGMDLELSGGDAYVPCSANTVRGTLRPATYL